MPKIQSKEEIQEYYKNNSVADEYINTRFKVPLGVIEHKQQIEYVKEIISYYNIKKILEIAPGPARLTAEIKNIEKGIAIDDSESMLKIAKERLYKYDNNKWTLEKQDAFNIQYIEEFEMVMTFRFLFHFHSEERKKLYTQIRKALIPNGIFMFEAINKDKAQMIRKIVGEDKYPIYDKLYTKEELIQELNDNGFEIVNMKNNINHFYIDVFISKITNLLHLYNFGEKLINYVERHESNKPLGWIVLCQKV